ncbi:MAG: hypothetical protein FIB07_16275 [Candidatus Methanoperedens sp.]|nr:hypothetical protein [Candidatus Methanoperedens sp.]
MKQVNLQLSEKTLGRVKEIAKNEELPYTSLIRNWIVQRVKEFAPAETLAREPAECSHTHQSGRMQHE